MAATDKPSTVDCSLSCMCWRLFMLASSACELCCCSISTRVRSRLLMRETRCDSASWRRVAQAQVLRAGLKRRSMNSPMVCMPGSAASSMSLMRLSTSSK